MAKAPTTHKPATAYPYQVLLLEDHKADKDFFLACLEKEGNGDFEHFHVSTLHDAVHYLSRHNVDIIALDLGLPDSRGLETLEALHHVQPSAATVILAHHDDQKLALEAMKCGAQEYLIKDGLSPDLLVRSLRYALERKRHEVELQEKNEQLEELLRFDPLTGLISRRYGMEILESELARHERYGDPLSVLLLDIDDFKRINDELSHIAGDKALCIAANYLKESLRATDYAIRYGGDEFLVILVGSTAEEAENVCKKIQQHPPVCCLTDDIVETLTYSIGGAGATEHSTSKDMIARADLAMLVAKKLGKARYHIDPDNAGGNENKNLAETLKITRTSVCKTLCRAFSAILEHLDRHHDVFSARREDMLALGRHLARQNKLSNSETAQLENAIMLYDFTKINLSLEIASTNDLTHEYRSMLIKTILRNLSLLRDTGFLHEEASILSSVYEWWNGNGFPKGLNGEEIPRLSRIVSIVAAYSLLRHGGPYTPVHSSREAIDCIKEDFGTHFDPGLKQAFMVAVRALEQGARLANQPQVLVVDDYFPVRDILTKRLSQRGYSIEAADSLDAAKAQLENSNWDAVIVDLGMGDECGFDLLEFLSVDAAYASIVPIVISSRSDDEAINLSRELGADGYIIKPFHLDRVESMLSQLIQQPKAQRDFIILEPIATDESSMAG